MFTAEELLLPIDPDQPCGADMAFSVELDAIAQARKFDDPSLEQGEWVTELKEADWDFVVKRCSALLAAKTKDLRLAVWLAEAAAKQFQLRGLGEGFSLLAGLVERYWDQGLYPDAEDGDQEQRIGNLAWILSRTRALVREVPLTHGQSRGRGGWSTLDFEAARKRAGSGAEPDDLPKLAEMEAARRANPSQFAAALHADAQYCVDALQRLEMAADAKLGQDSPGFAGAREALQGLLHALPSPAGAVPLAASASMPAAPEAGAGATFAGADPAGAAFAGADSAGAGVRGAPAGAAGPLRTRAQAIAQLRDVARFFRDTEPHSPVSYFADKAADAGEQDLHTWLRSVIKDHGSLAHIEELLGVPPSS